MRGGAVASLVGLLVIAAVDYSSRDKVTVSYGNIDSHTDVCVDCPWMAHMSSLVPFVLGVLLVLLGLMRMALVRRQQSHQLPHDEARASRADPTESP